MSRYAAPQQARGSQSTASEDTVRRRKPVGAPPGTVGVRTPDLPVASPSDPLELEARAAADRFVGDHGPRTGHRTNASGPVQGLSASPAGGAALDPETREPFNRRFGFDFSRVRVHTDAQAAKSAGQLSAQAYSVGHDVVFGRNQFAPSDPRGAWLLAHELAHVVQYSRGAGNGMVHRQPEMVPGLDHDLDIAVKATPSPDWAAAAKILNRFNKEDILLRLESFGPDDRERLYANAGPDSQLAQLLKPRLKEQVLADPFGPINPATGETSSVKAFFFQGRTNQRALIIGGVHNKTEPQGREVVERLQVALTANAAKGILPYFTTVLVPELFKQDLYSGPGTAARWIKGGTGLDKNRKLQQDRAVEPNRNFPLPGEGLSAAHDRGTKGPDAAELVFPDPAGGPPRPSHDKGAGKGGTSTRLLPENRALIALIERFRPDRIASVHAHSPLRQPGNAPGIFVDPRGGGGGADDDRLATAMVQQGRQRLPPDPARKSDPFVGNAPGTKRATVHYSPSATHSEGNSLGDWAPVAVTGPGARLAITTVTVEVPQRAPEEPAGESKGVIDKIEELDSDLLADIFLEDQTVVAPSTGAVTP